MPQLNVVAAPPPRAALAAGVVLAVIAPVVVNAFLGWDSIYPVDGSSRGPGSSGRPWLAEARS